MSSRMKVVSQLESSRSVKATLPPASRIVWHGTVGMPHRQERPSQADDVPRETIIAVRHPPVAPQGLPYTFSKLVVGHLNPIRAKPIVVQLDVRHVERFRNLPSKRRLPRARRSLNDDALGIPRAAFSIWLFTVGHDAPFAVQHISGTSSWIPPALSATSAANENLPTPRLGLTGVCI